MPISQGNGNTTTDRLETNIAKVDFVCCGSSEPPFFAHFIWWKMGSSSPCGFFYTNLICLLLFNNIHLSNTNTHTHTHTFLRVGGDLSSEVQFFLPCEHTELYFLPWVCPRQPSHCHTCSQHVEMRLWGSGRITVTAGNQSHCGNQPPTPRLAPPSCQGVRAAACEAGSSGPHGVARERLTQMMLFPWRRVPVCEALQTFCVSQPLRNGSSVDWCRGWSWLKSVWRLSVYGYWINFCSPPDPSISLCPATAFPIAWWVKFCALLCCGEWVDVKNHCSFFPICKTFWPFICLRCSCAAERAAGWGLVFSTDVLLLVLQLSFVWSHLHQTDLAHTHTQILNLC